MDGSGARRANVVGGDSRRIFTSLRRTAAISSVGVSQLGAVVIWDGAVFVVGGRSGHDRDSSSCREDEDDNGDDDGADNDEDCLPDLRILLYRMSCGSASSKRIVKAVYSVGSE